MTDPFVPSKEIPALLWDAYRNLSNKIAEHEQLKKVIIDQVKDIIGEAEYATVGGNPVFRWQHVSDRRVDMSLLREKVDPAILSQCYVQRAGRRFTILKDDQS